MIFFEEYFIVAHGYHMYLFSTAFIQLSETQGEHI